FPTAMRLALLRQLDPLIAEVTRLRDALAQKGREFDSILKSGRTHLQDAVPIRLGQEFTAYAVAVERNLQALDRCRPALLELGIGGTAVGTGLNAEVDYIRYVVKEIGRESGYAVFGTANLVETTQNMDPFVTASSALKGLAITLIRLANDLRLLASGPRTGLNEITLPPVQPGSSIMPGKVNPSIPEMVNMVAFQALGSDTVVMLAAQAGQLELNVMMPVIAHNLLFTTDILANAVAKLVDACIVGITANGERCQQYLENSLGMVTVFAPYIGYEAAAAVAKESADSGESIVTIVRRRGLMAEAQLKGVLDPLPLTAPGVPGKR
ncbi:MAG TPA: lyase family protein, partial [Geobacterales bacterium]|nr:lyase family protein [Geobacterales bacterium]